MRRLLLLFIIGCAGLAGAATITASGNASTSSNTNWTGGVKPNCTGDLIVTAGFAVTQDVAGCIIGDKSAATGIGASCSASGGSFTVAAATTFRGFNTTTAPFWKTVANCTINLSGQAITYDGPTTYTTAINDGIYSDSSSTTVDIPSANITWSNASGNNTYASHSQANWNEPVDIYLIKLENPGASLSDPGPISNSGGTGLGSFGDSSITFSAGGFQGTTHVEKDCSGVFAGTQNFPDVLTANGDFCVDYPKGVLWYKTNSTLMTVTLAFKYGTWGGWGIISSNNAANSSISINGTYSHCGDIATSSENSGGCFHVIDKYATGMGHDTQSVAFGNSVVFNYASRPVQLYCPDITCYDATHFVTWTSPQFNNNRTGSGLFQTGLIQAGYVGYFHLTSPVLNTYTNLFNSVCRQNGAGDLAHFTVSGAIGNGSNAGHWLNFKSLPSCGGGSTFSNATALNGFQGPDFLVADGSADGSFVSVGGNSTNGANVYNNNQLNYTLRTGRLDNYMTVTNNRICRSDHHSYISPGTGDHYIDGSTITFSNNITCDMQDAGQFPGGFTFGYNHNAWIDGVVIDHNTFDFGTRCINFNDEETQVILATRIQAKNSICSNNLQGIYRPTGSATNVAALAIAINDYNLDYNNTTNPTNVTQVTFMRNAAEYNTGTRNVAGVYLFNPQGYSLPDATSRALVSTVSGTLGTRASGAINIAWSGGAAVNFVFDEGTLSAYSAAGSCPDGSACSQLTDSTATWTASSGAAAGLRAYQVIIVSGTGSGQYCMVVSNTATALTCIANRTAANTLATGLDNTSKYILIKPDQQLFDSGASNSVRAGIHSPTLVLTTQTDSGITMALNRPTAADPNYVNSAYPTYNFHPRLSTLNNTASDGTFIGALSVTLTSNCVQKIGGSGVFNCGANSIGRLRWPSLMGAGF